MSSSTFETLTPGVCDSSQRIQLQAHDADAKRCVMARLLPIGVLVECSMKIVDRPEHRLIHLAGRLAEAQVPELFRACGDRALLLELDLAELISVDAVGLEALHSLHQGGATLLEVPAYIQLKLDSLSAKKSKLSR
jgi:hypothetical protein